MFAYSIFKLDLLLSRRNPNISSFTEESIFTSEDRLDLHSSGLRFAWAIEGYIDKTLKNDTQYVKTIIRMEGKTSGKRYEKLLDYHICTEDDFKDFAEPTPDAANMLKSYLSGKNRALYCFDWEQLRQEMQIWGSTTYDDFQ